MENQNERDEVLFAQLKKAKRRKRRRIIITVVLVLVLALLGGAGAVVYLRGRVQSRFAQDTAEVKSCQATTGRISSTVSGSGSLSYLDFEDVTVPTGVTVEEVLISRGDILEAGEVIARVDVNSVMTALADTQTALEKLENCLTIPVAALVEQGNKTMVYTLFDEKSQTLTGLTPVETGLSDGEYVQILSGLTEDAAVWYRYYDQLELSNSVEKKSGFG